MHADYSYQHSGYQGPANVTKVKDLSRFSFMDRDGIIEGYLIRRIDIERFVFQDDTGEMVIQLDDGIYLPNVSGKTLVRVYGEYEGGFKQELGTDYVEVIPQGWRPT